MNYYDILLAKKLEDERDPKVEGLSVTANGTYSEEGKVYKPVVVNVPLPSNAYLLKSIENVNIATFTDGTDNFLKSLKVAIEPQQEGSGDPSPTNIRPISGWTACNVVRTGGNLFDVANTATIYPKLKQGQTIYAKQNSANDFGLYVLYEGDSQSTTLQLNSNTKASMVLTKDVVQIAISDSARNALISQGKDIMVSTTDFTDIESYNGNTYTINFVDGSNPLTVYGGTLDVVSGVLTVDRAYFKYFNVSTTSGTAVTDGWRCNFTCPTDDINRGKWSIQPGAIPIFSKISSVAKGYGANEYTVTLPNVTSKQEADAMLEGLEICYKLATPLTIQLTPTIIKSLQGENNFFADSGEIELLQYFGKETA